MSKPVDPFDELANDDIFSELRAFASQPVAENPQVLVALQQEFAAAGSTRPRRWFKRLVIPTVTLVIAIPSLAYAGLLPQGVSANVKHLVHTVGNVITKPVVAITNSLTGNSDGENSDETSPSPSAHASHDASESSGNENVQNQSSDENQQGNSEDQGDGESAAIASSSPAATKNPHTKSSAAAKPGGSIASPSADSNGQENNQENEAENETENENGN